MAKVPENAQQLFNVDVPEALKKFPDKAREIGAIYLFKIAGDGGGTWTVNLQGNPPTVTPGDAGNAQCTFEVAHDDFKQMLTNPAMGMQLYFQGKLKVTGDPMLATKLQKLFTLTG
jgi:putative sterol carrier protein